MRRLADFAYNYWWSWTPDRVALFSAIDPGLWQRCRHNPVALLESVSHERLWQLAEDPHYLKRLYRLSHQLDCYLNEDNTWASRVAPMIPPEHPVAYFCIEFGIHESIPIYCGGLGVLAGGHLKSASDLGLPMVGIGLLYKQGYFRQWLNRSGWQEADYVDLDFSQLPMEKVCNEYGQPITVKVNIRQRLVKVQVWQIQVGRSVLYLLDTDLPENDAAARALTGRLYGGDLDTQMAQEVLLGIGGVRVLQALGIEPSIYHLNEVHAVFALLEIALQTREETGQSFEQIQALVRDLTVFTTHTPVPVGNVFSAELMTDFFAHYWPQLGLTREEFLALGARQPDQPWEPFSLVILALRLTRAANGVSRQHGHVSRQMWQALYPNRPVEAVPIGHITNGIHVRTWVAPLMADLYEDYLGRGWSTQLTNTELWNRVEEIPNEALWHRHSILKARLVAYTRDRVRQAREARGEADDDINAVGRLLDPQVLTIGFARRFSAYKRSDLIFRDLQRMSRILAHSKRPIQIILAGKAHPDDHQGKRIIQRLMEWSRHPDLRDRVAFIEDYDLYTTKLMVQGVDLWLNTCRRTFEASGTSGQKAALNGVLNLSVQSGWWCEGYQAGINGWEIGEALPDDRERQDAVDAESLYTLLERDIARLYYSRDRAGLSRGWLRMMKASIRTITPRFNTDRMVAEYVTQMYLPQPTEPPEPVLASVIA